MYFTVFEQRVANSPAEDSDLKSWLMKSVNNLTRTVQADRGLCLYSGSDRVATAV